MEIEETLPKRSSFGRVVALTGLALLCFFLIAWFLLHKARRVPSGYTKTPVSQLVIPLHPSAAPTTFA